MVAAYLGRTVAELGATVSYPEFIQWLKFIQLERYQGISGSSNQRQERSQGWEATYAKMHRMATAKDRNILVPHGKTPQQVWDEMRDEW